MTLIKKFRSLFVSNSPLVDIVPPEIEEYAAAHSVAESDVCRLIREETYRTQDCPQMVVGSLEGAFLKVMALAVRALEAHADVIGTRRFPLVFPE